MDIVEQVCWLWVFFFDFGHPLKLLGHILWRLLLFEGTSRSSLFGDTLIRAIVVIGMPQGFFLMDKFISNLFDFLFVFAWSFFLQVTLDSVNNILAMS
jgi:hypothetical protein